jgi:hypothetical protein
MDLLLAQYMLLQEEDHLQFELCNLVIVDALEEGYKGY